MCGGTPYRLLWQEDEDGLSPRVRGNQVSLSVMICCWRSIPACAGEPVESKDNPLSSGVYPRVCGGTRADDARRAAAGGLSPRVRGNRVQQVANVAIQRSIPACAGEPAHAETQSRESAVIPACAGEPTPRDWAFLLAGVYPRVCGGTAALIPAMLSLVGLSPRVRGNQPVALAGVNRNGSIPACAGEPTERLVTGDTNTVYPRVCGGTPHLHAVVRGYQGLSPRVRGNQPVALAGVNRNGSIPACAGEPTERLVTGDTNTVYPRVCGGTPHLHAVVRGYQGLSPRVRGNQ